MLNSDKSLFQIGEGIEEQDSNLSCIKEILLQCDGATRKHICDIYGFKIQMDGDDFLISHDGQRIGAGKVSVLGKSYAIEVYPKNTGLKINELFSYFGAGLNKAYGSIHNLSYQGIEGKSGEYSFSFLLGLLSELSSFGVHFFNIYSTRKKVNSKGKPQGRIVPKSFVKNQLMGKFDEFECEILDNSQLRLFATVFYHTAMSVSNDLSKLGASNALKGLDIQLLTKVATLRLKPYVLPGFSRQMLNRLSKPPYPFGVKELFFRCLKYWTNKGGFSASESNNAMSFTGFSMRLDYLFEDYVGLLFEKLFGEKVEHIPKRRFSYTEEFDEDRMIEPDHIYVDKKNRKLTVVEVKYSNNIAVRDHVAQLISYLDFQYAEWDGFEKVGLVVYPGNFPSCKKLTSFKHDLRITKVTSDIELSKSIIHDQL
ncbi:hypothetical protein [Vibrio parahaemolyticus]|uniref:hypothetical protein n=1 Tax=Vibrio parahaemolyticus TaxID=670 RepID=UPI0038915739